MSEPAGLRTVNVVSTNPETEVLSNFAASPFVLDGRPFASVEAFIHFIKISTGVEGRPFKVLRQTLPGLWSKEAFRAGQEINDYLRPHLQKHFQVGQQLASMPRADAVTVSWGRKRWSYGSPEHHQLIGRAIRAKFEQNPAARAALLATGDAILIHETGGTENPFTSLPAPVFCKFLTDLRQEFARQKTV